MTPPAVLVVLVVIVSVLASVSSSAAPFGEPGAATRPSEPGMPSLGGPLAISSGQPALRPVGGIEVPYPATPAISAARTSYDVGQNATVQGSGFGASLAIGTFTLGSFSLRCTSATVGRCSAGGITTDAGGSFAVTFLIPSVTTAGNFTLSARDSGGNSASTTLSVFLDPYIYPITASRPTADVGQIVEFSAVVVLGSGGYSYLWRGLFNCNGTTDPFNCTTSLAGTHTLTLQVTDSNQFQLQRTLLAYTVYEDPVVAVPTVVGTGTTAGVASADVGQNLSFGVHPSLGTGVYEFYTWTGLPSNCSGNSSYFTCVPTHAASGPVQVTVTDSNGATSLPGTARYTVFDDPAVATPTANRSSADVGQAVSFATSVRPGSGAYTLTWSGLPLNCPSPGSALEANCTVSWPGLATVRVSLTDSNRYATTSGILSFPVYADPTIAIRAPRTQVDPGIPFDLFALVARGSGGFGIVWSGLPPDCPTSGANLTCTTAATGVYHVGATVTDSNGISAASTAPLLLQVASPLAVNITVEPGTPVVRQVVSFGANASGGIGPRSYAWQFGDGASGSRAAAEHAYAGAGTYRVELWVNDSIGASVERTVVVPVTNEGPTFLGLPGNEGYEVLGGVLVALAIGAIVLVALRHRRPAGPATAPDTPRGPEEAGEDRPD